MVEFNTENVGGAEDANLEETLTEAWTAMLASQQAVTAFCNESRQKPIGGENGQRAFFNSKLVSHSFLVILT